MNAPLQSQSILAKPKPQSFPTRGVPSGWHDPWDADPLDGVAAAIRQRNALRRHVNEAEAQLELVAQARADGRWEAHVTSSDAAPPLWSSVNGPTAALALDALEAEVRELLRGGGAGAEAEG